MRRIRKRLIGLAVVVLVATVLISEPSAAQDSPPVTAPSSTATKTLSAEPSNRGNDVVETARVSVPDPSGVVTNEVETVAVGFSGESSDESPCTWWLVIEDDLQQMVKVSASGGFTDLGGFLLEERASLSGAVRTYSSTGRWWSRNCPDGGVVGIASISIALFPEGEAVSVEELILRSIDTLDPPDPVVTVLPPGKQLVQFPSLFWVDPVYWDAERADTQTAGRVSSSVRLVPKFSVWNPGDGNEPVTCDGPGEIWEEDMDPDYFDCTYTYKTVAGQPFPFTATVQFDIEVGATIGGAPAPGNLGPYEFLERTTEIELGVREIQVVETNG